MEEETMESDVMDAKGSLHQKPRDVCDTEAVMLKVPCIRSHVTLVTLKP